MDVWQAYVICFSIAGMAKKEKRPVNGRRGKREMWLWLIRWFERLCEFDLCDPVNDYFLLFLYTARTDSKKVYF